DAWVAHTLETRQASGVLFSLVQDAEAGVRAMLISGDRSYLARYNTARDAIPGAMAQLRGLSRDNPAQLARLDAVAALIERRLDVLAATAAIAIGGDQTALTGRLHSREGATVMDQIRATLGAFDQAEADLLVERETVARHARAELLFGSIAALSLALLLGVLIAILSQRQARALRVANAQLADTVSDRTGELRDSETRFRQVFNDSPFGLAISTAETRRIVAANPAVC